MQPVCPTKAFTQAVLDLLHEVCQLDGFDGHLVTKVLTLHKSFGALQLLKSVRTIRHYGYEIKGLGQSRYKSHCSDHQVFEKKKKKLADK